MRTIKDYNAVQRFLIWLGVMKSDADKYLDAKHHEATRKLKARTDRANTIQMQRMDGHRRPGGKLAGLLLVALLLSGCSAVKPLGDLFITYALPTIKELVADTKARGQTAIDDFRERAEAIPDQLDRIEAMQIAAQVERAYQTGILEELAARYLQPIEWEGPFLVPLPEHPPVKPEPDA